MSETMITSGPSKFDLAQALLVRKPTRPSITLFIQGSKNGIEVFVDSLEAESGCGECWNIEGYAGNNKKFTAFYRTDRRIGCYRVAD